MSHPAKDKLRRVESGLAGDGAIPLNLCLRSFAINTENGEGTNPPATIRYQFTNEINCDQKLKFFMTECFSKKEIEAIITKLKPRETFLLASSTFRRLRKLSKSLSAIFEPKQSEI